MTDEATRREVIQKLVAAGARWGYAMAERGEPFRPPTITWSEDGIATIDSDLSEHTVRSYDVCSPEWNRMPDEDRETVLRVLREHGVDPYLAYRVDVLALGTGVLRVWQYQERQGWKLHLEPRIEPAAVREPFMVPCRAPELFGDAAP